MNKLSKSRGYGIIELVVYVSILSVMAILSVNGMLSITRVFAEIKSYNDLRSGGLVGMERMEKEVRFASSIDYANSIFNINPGKLTINTTDELGNSKVVSFAVNSSSLDLIDGGVYKGSLSGDNVSVINMIFRQSTTTKGILIKMEMTIMDKRTRNPRSANFYTSAVMRGSY